MRHLLPYIGVLTLICPHSVMLTKNSHLQLFVNYVYFFNFFLNYRNFFLDKLYKKQFLVVKCKQRIVYVLPLLVYLQIRYRECGTLSREINLRLEAVQHYNRMMKGILKHFILKGDTSSPNYIEVFSTVGEAWGGEFCPYCKRDSASIGFSCPSCALYPKEEMEYAKRRGDYDERVGDFCCNGLWRRLNAAKSWRELYIRMYLVRMYIVAKG